MAGFFTSHPGRLWIAGIIWVAGLSIWGAFGYWNLSVSHADADNRLRNEAGRTASQISSLLAAVPLTRQSLNAIIGSAMEDEPVYAIQIQTRNGLLEGQRRNYLWEPIPWDDEIPENCVQGMDPIRRNGVTEGKVEVWLSTRLAAEEQTQQTRREQLRFFAAVAIWTLAFLALLWYWGAIPFSSKWNRNHENLPEPSGATPPAKDEGEEQNEPFTSRALGLQFCQAGHAWPLIAGLFRQTYNRAPNLISRLYEDGDDAALCHLARTLEQCAPLIGAKPLEKAARQLQNELNNPTANYPALSVDHCASTLENTLQELAGSPVTSNAGDAAVIEPAPQEE